MTALLAFVSFVIATVIFVLRAAELGDVDIAWGFVFTAGGLALMTLGGGYAWVQGRQRG